jgi:hypothetical protein
MKRIFIALLALLYTSVCLAHEEPAKSLKEKSDKENESQKIKLSGIKTATVWKTTYENNKTVKTKVFIMRYNKDGRMTAIEAYKNDSLRESTIYTFDKAGNMLTDTDIDANGNVTEINTFTFDMPGRVVFGEAKDDKGKQDGYFKVIHSADGKTIEFHKFYTGDSLEYKLVYTYKNSYDKEDYIKAVKYSADNSVILKVEKKLNKDGNAEEKIVYDKDAKETYRFIYEFDENGNQVKMTKKRADGKIEWSDVNSFDKNGNTNGMKSYDAQNVLKFELIYDFEYYK